jgi:hypothetical protein
MFGTGSIQIPIVLVGNIVALKPFFGVILIHRFTTLLITHASSLGLSVSVLCVTGYGTAKYCAGYRRRILAAATAKLVPYSRSKQCPYDFGRQQLLPSIAAWDCLSQWCDKSGLH